jgi:predicted GIY-YIG superfamily endonuclease
LPRSNFPFVERWRDRHGRVRVYFRKDRGQPRIVLPSTVGSPEFEEAYQRALAGGSAKAPPQSISISPRAISSLVYFVKIGKVIKIGFTTDLEKRLKTFRTATAEIMQVLAVFPGNRNLETRLHTLFDDIRICNEFFHDAYQIQSFLWEAERSSLAAAIERIEQIRQKPRQSQSELSRAAHARRRWALEECIAESNARALAREQTERPPQ